MTEEELVKLLMENPDKIHKMIWNEAMEKAAAKVKSNNKLMIAILKLRK